MLISRSLKRFLVVGLILATLAGLCMYRVLFSGSGPLERISASLVYPFLVIQHKLVSPFKSYFHKRANIAELEQQLKQVQHERDELVAQNIELQSVIDYLEEIHELVDFKKQYEYEQAPLAQVLARNLSEQAHFFLIDKGAHDNINVDMVALYKNCIIGKVVEVYPRYSKLMLVTDNSCKISATCAKSKAVGIYQGTNQEWLSSMAHVSHLSMLEAGDLVISSGEGLVFPRGFGLGRIKSFTKDGLFHQVAIEPLVDPRLITHCYLIQKGSPGYTPTQVPA